MSEDNLYDLAAERNVLAGLYQYGQDAYYEVQEFITEKTFTDETNKIFFKCLISLFEQGIEKPDISSIHTVINNLGFGYLLNKKDETQHIKSIINTDILQVNITTWAVKIRKLEITRLLRKQLSLANKSLADISGNESIEQILGIAENSILDFTELLLTNKDEKPQLFGENIDEWIEYVENNPTNIIGISSGYPLYDIAIGGGFRRKTVSLIGARPGQGKSFESINIGLNISKNDIPVLYLDTEMNELDHYPRILANLVFSNGGKITINDIESGKYSRSEFNKKKIRQAKEQLKKLPFHYMNISGKSFESILSIMRRWICKYVGIDDNGKTKPCIIIYDYLKLMSAENLNGNLAEFQMLGFLMTSLHNFTVKHDIPILSFIQLNRDGIDKEATDAIAGSDRIVWLTTNFTIFKDKSPDEIAMDTPTEGNKKMVVLKSRHGSGIANGDYINVIMKGEFGKIIEGRTRYMIRDSQQKINNDKKYEQDDGDIPISSE